MALLTPAVHTLAHPRRACRVPWRARLVPHPAWPCQGFPCPLPTPWWGRRQPAGSHTRLAVAGPLAMRHPLLVPWIPPSTPTSHVTFHACPMHLTHRTPAPPQGRALTIPAPAAAPLCT
eukprot:gene6673-biopygen5531